MKILRRAFGTTVAVLAAVLSAFLLWAGLTPPVSVSAGADGGNDYIIEDYETEMTVNTDRTVNVTEEISVYFNRSVHGIIRDLPLGAGTYYRNVKASCDNADFAPYTQNDDSGYLSLYLRGEGTVKGQRRTYTISYDMTTPALDDGFFPVDVLGYGWYTTVEQFKAVVHLPAGVEEAVVYSGGSGATGNGESVTVTQTETEITLTASSLSTYSDGSGYRVSAGITLALTFQDGVLSFSPDLTVLWAVLAGLAALAVAAVVKPVFCRQPDMILSVNLTAPNEMDPFLMGKLIDNKADGEDYGALVFWLASKGYLHIDLTEDESNPVLYKSEKPLAADMPAHCRMMYEALFRGRESVRVRDLDNSFYTTAEAMKASVSASTGAMYKKGWALTIFFGVLVTLLLGGFAYLFSMLTVFAGYSYWIMFVGTALSYAPAAFCSNLAAQRKFKWKSARRIFLVLGGITVGIAIGAIMLFFPSAAFGVWTQLVLSVCAALAGAVGGTFLTRTKEYTEKLGHILGFKQFIVYTERDKIEFMLKENPELYYEILPYAQVLGVTDAWTEKFNGFDLKPPRYATCNTVDFAFNCLVWHTLFCTLNAGMGRSLISKPSSSGGKGGKGGFGGRFGGFGGGGFGGGGGRSC